MSSPATPDQGRALPPAIQTATDPVLVTFGDINISQHWLVTPVGTVPLARTQIFVTDLSREDKVIPAWAIVLAIIGFFFLLLGLLFLLVRETRTSGFMQITVTNGALTYQSAEPVTGDRAAQLYELQYRANYARGIIARATAAH